MPAPAHRQGDQHGERQEHAAHEITVVVKFSRLEAVMLARRLHGLGPGQHIRGLAQICRHGRGHDGTRYSETGTFATANCSDCEPYASGRCVRVGASSLSSTTCRVDITSAVGSRLSDVVGRARHDEESNALPPPIPARVVASPRAWCRSRCRRSDPHQLRMACGAQFSDSASASVRGRSRPPCGPMS